MVAPFYVTIVLREDADIGAAAFSFAAIPGRFFIVVSVSRAKPVSKRGLERERFDESRESRGRINGN